MIFEKRYGHEWDLFYCGNVRRIDPKVIDERPVNRIVFRLETEDSQRNIREGMGVYAVYFRFKTFKSFQALLNLSDSKAIIVPASAVYCGGPGGLKDKGKRERSAKGTPFDEISANTDLDK